MKNIIFLLLFSIVLISVSACNNRELTTDKDYKINDQLVVPKGSVLKIDKSSNSVDFTLPKGYVLLGETTDGSLSNLYGGGTLTCTCKSPKDGSCSPFVAQGPKGQITGCAMDNCTDCTGKVTGKNSSDSKVETLFLNKINIIKSDDVINFVVDLKEFESLRNPTSEIMNSELATTTITKFAKGFQNSNKELLAKTTDINKLKEIGYVLVPINFYGYKIYLPVDKSQKLIATNPMVNEVITKYLLGEGQYSCKCTSGENGCILKTRSIPLVGSATWCEAGSCSSCALTTN